jgi:hypothetical protein
VIDCLWLTLFPVTGFQIITESLHLTIHHALNDYNLSEPSPWTFSGFKQAESHAGLVEPPEAA